MLPIRSGLAAVLSFACLVVPASAQVTVRQNWIAPGGVPRTCVFTTDAAGVVMNPDGSLQMSGSYGENCPNGTVTPPTDPSITNGIDSTEIPSSTTAGASHSISWAADADTCSYSTSALAAPISLWPTSGNVCSSAAGCATNHNVTFAMPSTPGTYKFELTCRKTGSSVVATSTRTTTIPSVGTGSCPGPAGLTRATRVFADTNISTDQGRDVDATVFEESFGYNSSGGAPRPFPGTAGLNQSITIGGNTFIAMRFTVPSNLAAGTSGLIARGETVFNGNPGPVTFTISKTCGDFSLTPVAPLNAKCARQVNTLGDGVPWGYSPSGTSAVFCPLERGQTYYLNILYGAANATTTCTSASTCERGIVHQLMSGSPAWPSMIDATE